MAGAPVYLGQVPRTGLLPAWPGPLHTERTCMTQRFLGTILLALAAMAALGCTHVTDRYQAAAPDLSARG
ncbi:hypothetical protein MyNCGM70_15410 [Achromobacter xylosoxidans]|nr:hypothetical protein HMPREF0005_00640 [Achromobacter xylosoxidans C54]